MKDLNGVILLRTGVQPEVSEMAANLFLRTTFMVGYRPHCYRNFVTVAIPIAGWIVITFAILANSSAISRAATNIRYHAPSYRQMAESPLNITDWSGRSFTFLNYGGPWLPSRESPALTRVASECQIQHILTPTWSFPAFVEPVESVDSEWDTNLLALMEKEFKLHRADMTRKMCYQIACKYYLARNHMILYPSEYRGFNTKGCKFFTMTGHSYYSLYGAQWGCSLLGIELGENIIASQSKIAFARGAARQYNKPLYADISPWDAGLNAAGQWVGMIPLFNAGEGANECKNIPSTPAARLFHNPSLSWTGGHSPSLLSRLWYVCWLSGFSVEVPEDCQENFFAYNPSSAPNYVKPTIFVPRTPSQRAILSPIGANAKQFLSVVHAHPKIGIPYTPFAVMLDKYTGFGAYALTFPRPWGVLKPRLGDREIQLYWNTVFPGSMDLDQIVPSNEPNESHRLVAGPYGDTFDVLLTDAPERILRCYPTLILLGHITFSNALVSRLEGYIKSGGVLCISYHQISELKDTWQTLRSMGKIKIYGFHGNHPRPLHPETQRWLDTAVWGFSSAQIAQIKAKRQLRPYEQYFVSQIRKLYEGLAKTYLPVAVRGHVEYLINRLPNGWLIGIVNNLGVTKLACYPVRVDPTKLQSVHIFLRDGRLWKAKEWVTGRRLKMEHNGVTVEVPPGEVRIVRLIVHS